MKKILIDSNIPFLREIFPNNYDISEFRGRELSADVLKSTDCRTLFIRSTVKAGAQLLAGSRVEFLATATSGYDHVDTDYLFRNSIYFAGALGSNANSVAEYVVFSILKWAALRDVDLRNKSIGIIGYGNVGRHVAKYAALLGMRVFVNDPPLYESGYRFPSICRYLPLNDLIAQSDVLTNHVPLIQLGDHPTVDLLNSENLASFRSEGLLIHASRGGVCDEDEMMRLAKEKNVALAIDVWKCEPLFNENLARIAMIATPHVAGHSLDGKLRGSAMMARAYTDFYREELNTEPIEKLLDEYKPLKEEAYTNLGELLSRLAQSRQIDKDTTSMLGFLALDESDRRKAFEHYRAAYPVRREIL